MTKRKWLILVAVVVVAAMFVALSLNRSAQAQHFTAKVERGAIKDVLEATGTINSVITVQVGSQVSGSIAKLNADLKRMSRKKDSPRSSERCGRGNLHPAPPLLTSFLEG